MLMKGGARDGGWNECPVTMTTPRHTHSGKRGDPLAGPAWLHLLLSPIFVLMSSATPSPGGPWGSSQAPHWELSLSLPPLNLHLLSSSRCLLSSSSSCLPYTHLPPRYWFSLIPSQGCARSPSSVLPRTMSWLLSLSSSNGTVFVCCLSISPTRL